METVPLGLKTDKENSKRLGSMVHSKKQVSEGVFITRSPRRRLHNRSGRGKTKKQTRGAFATKPKKEDVKNTGADMETGVKDTNQFVFPRDEVVLARPSMTSKVFLFNPVVEQINDNNQYVIDCLADKEEIPEDNSNSGSTDTTKCVYVAYSEYARKSLDSDPPNNFCEKTSVPLLVCATKDSTASNIRVNLYDPQYGALVGENIPLEDSNGTNDVKIHQYYKDLIKKFFNDYDVSQSVSGFMKCGNDPENACGTNQCTIPFTIPSLGVGGFEIDLGESIEITMGDYDVTLGVPRIDIDGFSTRQITKNICVPDFVTPFNQVKQLWNTFSQASIKASKLFSVLTDAEKTVIKSYVQAMDYAEESYQHATQKITDVVTSIDDFVSETIAQAVQQVTAQTSQAYDDIVDQLSSAVSQAKQEATEQLNEAIEFFNASLNGLSEKWSEARQYSEEKINELKQQTTELIAEKLEEIEELKDTIPQLFNQYYDQVSNSVESTIDQAVSSVNNWYSQEFIPSLNQKIGEANEYFQEIIDAGGDIAVYVGRLLDELGEKISSMAQYIDTGIYYANLYKQRIGEFMADFDMEDFLSQLQQFFSDLTANTLGQIIDAVTDPHLIQTVISSVVVSSVDAFKQAIGDVDGQEIAEKTGEALSTIILIPMEAMGNAFKQPLLGAKDAIADSFKEKAGEVKEFFDPWHDTFVNFSEMVKGTPQTIGELYDEKIASKYELITDKALLTLEKMNNAIEAVREAPSTFKQDMDRLYDKVSENITETYERNRDKVLEALERNREKVEEFFIERWEETKQDFQQAVGILDQFIDAREEEWEEIKDGAVDKYWDAVNYAKQMANKIDNSFDKARLFVTDKIEDAEQYGERLKERFVDYGEQAKYDLLRYSGVVKTWYHTKVEPVIDYVLSIDMEDVVGYGREYVGKGIELMRNGAEIVVMGSTKLWEKAVQYTDEHVAEPLIHTYYVQKAKIKNFASHIDDYALEGIDKTWDLVGDAYDLLPFTMRGILYLKKEDAIPFMNPVCNVVKASKPLFNTTGEIAPVMRNVYESLQDNLCTTLEWRGIYGIPVQGIEKLANIAKTYN